MAEGLLTEAEKSLRKLVLSLDKGIHFEALMKEEGAWIAILSKGIHSDRAMLAEDLVSGYLKSRKGEKELRQTIGKVIGKLNRMAQQRRR